MRWLPLLALLLFALPALPAHAGDPIRPDPRLSPGEVVSSCTVQLACVPGYSSTVRKTTQSMKERVYREYGIASHPPGQYEIDHIVPLSICGADTEKNLFPQRLRRTDSPWGAMAKDKLEAELHRRVCAKRMNLADAQRCIKNDWIACYKRVFKSGVP